MAPDRNQPVASRKEASLSGRRSGRFQETASDRLFHPWLVPGRVRRIRSDTGGIRYRGSDRGLSDCR